MFSIRSLSSHTPVEGMALPEGVLSPEICLEWRHGLGAGAGLHNLGNTCFVNSVLQCLTYTPPLANYFFSRVHGRSCRRRASCAMCAMEEHVCDALPSVGDVLFPLCVLDSLQDTGKRFLCGRQEDAHEFFCFMLLTMTTACTPGTSSLDFYSPSTTIVQQIFEGVLRSRLTCLRCGAVSDCYETFTDVPLDIKEASSVSAALQNFVRPERLDGANRIRCGRCDAMAAASKGLRVQDEPRVLTLSLKRSDASRKKLNKAVQFPLNLDIRPYMSQPKGEPCLYSLYAVLVHVGSSCDSGHYYCYVKAGDGLWYHMDDTSVTPCAVDEVLQQQAYLLFYVRCSAPATAGSTPSPVPPQARPLLSACEADGGRPGPPPCPGSDGSRKRPWSGDPSDAADCGPPARQRRRTDPPNLCATPIITPPGAFHNGSAQPPVPTAAMRQSEYPHFIPAQPSDVDAEEYASAPKMQMRTAAPNPDRFPGGVTTPVAFQIPKRAPVATATVEGTRPDACPQCVPDQHQMDAADRAPSSGKKSWSISSLLNIRKPKKRQWCCVS